MGKERKLFQNAKVVLSPSSRTLKIAVILLIVFSMIALGAMAWVRTSIRARTEDMRSEAAALEDENAAIEEKIDRLGTLESIKEIAREILGLVDPDTIIIETD
jgi:cell division protein FtsB